MTSHGHKGLFNYIDDLIYTGLPSEIHNFYQFLLNLLQELGLDISRKKLILCYLLRYLGRFSQ